MKLVQIFFNNFNKITIITNFFAFSLQFFSPVSGSEYWMLIRIRIQEVKWMRIQADPVPDPQPCWHHILRCRQLSAGFYPGELVLTDWLIDQMLDKEWTLNDRSLLGHNNQGHMSHMLRRRRSAGGDRGDDISAPAATCRGSWLLHHTGTIVLL